MKYTNAYGPQSMACLAFSMTAFGFISPIFQEGDNRRALLREIYQTPMFDQEPVFPLVFSAVASFCLSLLYFSKWFSDVSSRPVVGRVCAAVSAALLILALQNFSSFFTSALSMGTVFAFLSWWRSDPEDYWL